MEDVRKTIFSANTAIHKEEKIEKRKQLGYDKGFISGFISGNINTKWYNDYVVKQSNQYKEFLVFKSLKMYLDLFELERIKINKLYSRLLFDDLNIYQDTSVKHTNLQHESLNEIDIMPKDEILVVINNQIHNYINDYMKFNKPDFIDTVEKYFTEEDINYIINNEIAHE